MADNVTIPDYSDVSRTIAAVDLSGVHHQKVVPRFHTRSDTFTGAGNGTTVDCSTAPLSRFSLQVKGTGAAATAWNVVLEVSNNGTNFSTAITHASTAGHTDGQVILLSLQAPVLYYRVRCVSVTLGSATNVVGVSVGDCS